MVKKHILTELKNKEICPFIYHFEGNNTGNIINTIHFLFKENVIVFLNSQKGFLNHDFFLRELRKIVHDLLLYQHAFY